MRRAFTLIELLVVIAIIAILAAILFPVFAQAKEAAKKTTTLSHYKQMGTAVNIYIADSDDTFPLAQSYNTAAGTWRSVNLHAVPNGSVTNGGRDVEPRKSEEGAFVLNAIQPYAKNHGLMEAAGLAKTETGVVFVPGAAKPAINVTYNGLLQAWSATAVASPSKLPAFWGGNFKENLVGVSTSSPLLDCTGQSETCRFNPGGKAQPVDGLYGSTYIWFGAWTPANHVMWLYGKGMPFVMADSSARMIQLNAPKEPNYAASPNTQPFSSLYQPGVDYDGYVYSDGAPFWMTDCVIGRSFTTADKDIAWPGFFRPDSEFNFTIDQCNFGEK